MCDFVQRGGPSKGKKWGATMVREKRIIIFLRAEEVHSKQ